VIAAVTASLELVREADDARAALRRKATSFREGLAGLGLDTCGSVTQIVPLVAGEPARALAWSRALEKEGILAIAVRPPTVPPGTSRLRFSLSAAHADGDLALALDVVASLAARET
jgi:8-amino-7-oxononanoate synthase